MKKMKFILLGLVIMLTTSFTHSANINAENEKYENLFPQGSQYEQGEYDTRAHQPLAYNWSNNSPYNGTDVNKIRWKYRVTAMDSFQGQPVIGNDGTIYAGNLNHKLYALNPDGSLKWEYLSQESNIKSSASIGANNTIYFSAGRLYALNSDGSLKWKSKNGGFFQTPTIGKEGTVYAYSSDSASLQAYNPDGSLKWKSKSMSGKYSIHSTGSLIAADGTIYTITGNYLYAHKNNGEEKWNLRLGEQVKGGFSLGLNGEIYITLSKKLLVVSPTGTIQAEWSLNENLYGTPVVSQKDGIIYVGGAKNLFALNIDGSIKWKYPTKDYVTLSPLLDNNGTIYTGVRYDGIHVLNPDGTLKWKVDLSSSKVAFSNNNSLTMDKLGNLYLFAHELEANNSKSYNTIMSIGKATENICPAPTEGSGYIEWLEYKMKNGDLTSEEIQRAQERLEKDLDTLNKLANK
ncbi:PQQ-binding-like beta-propeller repeat protein [Bacillus sp. BR3(2024)]|uniref:PQQ-binding-like beta-propeller repeat protein n=1 Tax=Bacillus sp. BR3(2024) TaxID=3126755 RepID=UPI003183CB13